MKNYYEDIYQQLPEPGKRYADLLALIAQPVGRARFNEFFRAVSPVKNLNTIKSYMNELVRNGVLENIGDLILQLDDRFFLHLFPRAASMPEYRKYITPAKLREVIPLKENWISPFRDLLYGVFFPDNKRLTSGLAKIAQNCNSSFVLNKLILMIDIPVYHALLFLLPDKLQGEITDLVRSTRVLQLTNTNSLVLFIEKALEQKHQEEKAPFLKSVLGTLALYKGELGKARELITEFGADHRSWTVFVSLVVAGRYAEALEYFRVFLLDLRHQNNQHDLLIMPPDHILFFFLMARLMEGTNTDSTFFLKLLGEFEKSKEKENRIVSALMHYVLNDQFQANQILSYAQAPVNRYGPTGQFLYLVAVFLIRKKLPDDLRVPAEELFDRCANNGYQLFAVEVAWMLSKSFPEGSTGQNLQRVVEQLHLQPLLSRIRYREDWEIVLEKLSGMDLGKPDQKSPENISRIAYLVNFDHPSIPYVEPVLQSLTSRGWNKGRSISIKRLIENKAEGMTDQDRRIAATAVSGYAYGHYSFNFDRLLPELAGHPYLFYSANPDIPVELIKSGPELTVEKADDGFVLAGNITDISRKSILIKETNTRYKLISVTPGQVEILQALNGNRIIIPPQGKEVLGKTLARLSSVITIHSDLIDSGQNVKTVEADPRIRIQLLPVGNTLKAECFVKPFNTTPPYCKPGKGGKTVYGIAEGERCMAVRDLKAESDHLSALTAVIMEASGYDLSGEAVIFEEPDDCLDLIELLQQHSSLAVTEWPEGEKYKIRTRLALSQLRVSVKGRGYWFEMEGTVNVDENLVLSLKQLLVLSAKSKNRFVEIGEGEFVALSEEFRKRLEELQKFSSVGQDGVIINRFAASAIEELSVTAGVFEADERWKEFIGKIRDSANLEFQVPVTLDAELRSYQEEGFQWMARLAEWGAGACLADDMGLGKTIQSIALLLHRAHLGPSLVVCPASVGSNWISELRRFAPTLKNRTLSNSDRKETILACSSYDVLITSYGLLQYEADIFAERDWNMVILDEAHTIKNEKSKTTKAVMKLKAGFRLILTGTPVQNHLGELWTLFNFINPGLLGTLSHFHEQFVLPVEKFGQAGVRNHLKKLIAPFILRRTKTSVLDELPPKTEITQTLELSEKEIAFYEALRLQAIENIEAEKQAGQQHIRALAEITRLRMSCCHASLVNKEMKLPSSKLEVFMEIISELIENRHRALVFSQFIGYLGIVRKALEKKKIACRYLDGSTPVRDRAAIVRDFQNGNGSLFLISLKAGGLGLNLTGADYVIHLDPWWNPAVEDQASDRAHRIGQTRPVTIYRLVAKNTIEEKILHLHATKRDMADSLLEGTDQSGKLSTHELLDLLKIS